MFKNYFILNKLVIELNETLNGYEIISSYSFEKDKLHFILSRESEKENLSIEISVNPGFPYLTLKNKTSTPKRNLLHFFKDFLHSKINNVEISERDRIIRFSMENFQIYFTIRGKYTNVFAVNKNGLIENFKKSSNEIKSNFLTEVKEMNFISSFNHVNVIDSEIMPDTLKKKYPFIGKEIINELNTRNKNIDNKIVGSELNKVIRELKASNPAVFIDENTNEINLGIKGFHIFPATKIIEFTSLTEAFNFFLSQSFSRDNITDKKKIIERHLEKELRKITSRLNDINARIDRGSKEDEYKRYAELLLINLGKIEKRAAEIELNNIYNNNIPVKIKINPSLSPSQNADYYFDKAKNERKNYEMTKQLKSDFEMKYKKLKEIEKQFNSAEESDDFISILKELKIKTDQTIKPQDELKSKFKHYLLENKYHVYVGKDSKSNDLLTLKFSKQNDYWFHARSVSGSHVIIRIDNTKESVPKKILKKAASLAAYHSKAKTSGLVPVSYTQKKYVVKKKGMEPGKVALLKEDVLIVKPEIPKECEFIET